MAPKKKKTKYKSKDDNEDDKFQATSQISSNSKSRYREKYDQYDTYPQQQGRSYQYERQPQQQIKYKPKQKYVDKEKKQSEGMQRKKADDHKKQQKRSNDPKSEPKFSRQVQLWLRQFIYLWLGNVITLANLKQKQIKVTSKQSSGKYKYILSGNISPGTEKIWKNYLECYSFIYGDYHLDKKNLEIIKCQHQCMVYPQSVVSKQVGLICLEYPNKGIKSIRNHLQKEELEHYMIIRTQQKQTVLKFLQKNKLNTQHKAEQKEKHKAEQKENNDSESEEDNYQSFYQMMDDNGSKQRGEDNNKNKQQKKVASKTKIKSQDLLEDNNEDDSGARLIYTKKTTQESFDINDFKKWNQASKNKQLDVHIQEEDNHFLIKLYSKRRTKQGQNDQIKKLKGYTEFRKFLLIDESKKNAKNEIQKEITQMAPSGITYKIVKVPCQYKSQQKILIAYLEGKKNPNIQNFLGLYLQGLKNMVEEVYETLKSLIAQLPTQNRQVQLYPEVQDKISAFLKDQRVKKIIKEEIQILFHDEYPEYIFKSLLIKFNRISLELQMQASSFQKYQSDDRQKFINYFKDNHIYRQIDVSHAVYSKLSKKYPLFQHPETKKYFLFGHTSQIHQTYLRITKEINEMKKTIQKTIFLDKKYFPAAEELIDNLKNVKQTSFIDDILIHFNKEEEKILLKGYKTEVEEIYEVISDSIEEIKCKTISTYMVVDRQEALLFGKIQREKQFDEIRKKFNIELIMHKDIKIGAVVSLNKQNQQTDKSPLIIYIESGYSMENIPKNYTFYFRNQEEMQKFKSPITKTIKLKRQKQPSLGQIMHQQTLGRFIFDETYPDRLEEVFNDLVEENNEQEKVIVFVMPEEDKEQFILEIVETCQELDTNRIRVYIFQSAQIDLQNDLDLKSQPKGAIIEQPSYKFYVEQKGNKFYYSETGNRKIEDAYNNKQDLVYLNNEDVNMQIKSHIYDRNSQKVKHLQSQKQYQVKINQGKMFIVLDNHNQVRFPNRQVQLIRAHPHETEVKVSLGFYIIDLKNMCQINRFSYFKRDLKLELNKKVLMEYKYNMDVSFDYKINKIQIFYHEQNKELMNRIIKAIREKIDEFRVYRKRKVEDPQRVNSSFLEHIKALGNQSDVVIEFDKDQGYMHYSGIDENYVLNMMNVVDFMIDKLNTNKEEQRIQYPKFWIQDQAEQIQTFTVDPNSRQFHQIQSSFAAGKIVELLRIQNKLVFKKYHDEKMFLQNQINNKRPVRELMLFHGTSKTDPKIIYEDREECFNINYTSDRNTMGKGTYFAEKSEYSINYSFTEKRNSHQGFLNYLVGQQGNETIRSMFYCMVLVGDSQQISTNQPQRRDTDYKDPIKKIRYQSTTAVLLGSNIFVVYKNRRAYPLYLIKYK